MRRLKLLFCLLLGMVSTVAMADVTTMGLRFSRSGTDASSVTITVVDQDGTPISGAAATMTTSHPFKGTVSNVTESILCPNVNGNSSPTIVMTFNVTGVPAGFTFNNVGMDVHALNGGNTYQQNNDNKPRQYNVAIASGADEASLASFATLSDIDIAAGVGTSGAVHKIWDATAATSVTADGTLVLQLTITRGTTNSGCFFGLSELILSQGEAPEIPDTPETPVGINPESCYYIKWSQNPSLYITESTGNSLVVMGEDVAQKQFWQFEPTGKENCYYVKNVASGSYLQSCNMNNSDQSRVTVGATPVEYYVPLCETTGASVRGCYRFTSTDCPDYANSSVAPHGLNKDGASSNVIVWMATENNVGSWWKLEETEYLYDLRPFSFSDELGTAKFIYAISSATTGKALEMAADGTLSWAERTDADNQTWYFVGEGNRVGGGFLIANVGTGRTVNVAEEEQTKWVVVESGNAFAFRPHAKMDDETANLLVADEYVMKITEMRSKFSRASQIYTMPCGELGSAYVAKATVTGAVKPMTYPLAEVSGTEVSHPAASSPSMWYTIYSKDKATVAAGSSFDLNVTLNQAPAEGVSAWVYFDWNRDGIFEASYPLGSSVNMTETIAVPADAKAGESRMRVRLTGNYMEEADDCVAQGQIIDFLIYVVEENPEAYTCTVQANDPARGTVTHTEEGLAVNAVATPLGDASFLCWKESKNVVSVDADYAFTLDHSTHLTAFFTPITVDITTGIDVTTADEQNILLEVHGDRTTITVETAAEVRLVLVYTADGMLVGRSTTKQVDFSSPLQKGVYIVKAFTESSDKVCKAYIR